MTWPSINHSILSPSGHTSKRARNAAMKLEHDRLFPPGFWEEASPRPKQPTEREYLLRVAAELRALADRGMSARKYRNEAARLEAKAAALAEEVNPK